MINGFKMSVILCFLFSVAFATKKEPMPSMMSYACPYVAKGLSLATEPTKNRYVMKGPRSFHSGYPAINKNGTVNAVIEIPAGCNDKWEVKKSGHLEWDIKKGKPRFVKYLPYVGNYGMIPSTVMSPSMGGDGDPLDILVLGPAIPRGLVVKVRVIGVLKAKDKGQQDDKIIGVLADETPNNPFAKVKSIKALKKNDVMDIIKTWFENYKGPKKMEVGKVKGPKKAKAILNAAIKAHLGNRRRK